MTEQKILDNAPKGATHFEVDTYLKLSGHETRSLSDIKRIAELETDIHNLQRNLEAKDQGRCRTINEMSGMIRNLQEQLKAAQTEWISVEEFKPNGQRMFDVWYGNHRLSGIQLLDGDYWDTVSARYLDSSAITHCIMSPAPPEKGQ